MIKRRRILQTIGWAGLGVLLEKACRAGALFSASNSPLVFEEIASASSGISWAHVSGRSSEMSLPEMAGSGCAFLDFDNDGWMDIYLVNSGPCDFYAPPKPPRNALYRNNRDGTFTDVTLAAGVP